MWEIENLENPPSAEKGEILETVLKTGNRQ
jgi:hypothetical protein